MKKKILKKKRKRLNRILLILIFIIVLLVLVEFMTPEPPTEIPSESTTTIPETTTTTLFTTTTLITTTVPVTTTLENATTTIQVRKPISVIAYSCNYNTDIITLTISNRGNTKIEEDDIEIYIDDELIGIFGKEIEPGRLSKNSFQGTQGTNIVKAVSPSNTVRLVITCY